MKHDAESMAGLVQQHGALQQERDVARQQATQLERQLADVRQPAAGSRAE